MNTFQNHQKSLAEHVILREMFENQTCCEAMLHIKRWKFTTGLPGIAKNIITEANEGLQRALFCVVSNKFVLKAEEYHF